MYLLDTNIWLERLLEQERAREVAKFLDRIPDEKIHVTDFSFHSIAITLLKLKKKDLLLEFIGDLFLEGSGELIRLDPAETGIIIKLQEQFGLDFDDACQYAAAEKYGLELVSFDADFNRTAKGKKLPSEIA